MLWPSPLPVCQKPGDGITANDKVKGVAVAGRDTAARAVAVPSEIVADLAGRAETTRLHKWQEPTEKRGEVDGGAAQRATDIYVGKKGKPVDFYADWKLTTLTLKPCGVVS